MSKINVAISRSLDEYHVMTIDTEGNEGNFRTGSIDEALAYAKGFLSSEINET